MHAASLSEEWTHRAAEEAGISRLDSMLSADERLQTLNAVKLVSGQMSGHRCEWIVLFSTQLLVC